MKRRKAREYALQILYQCDLTKNSPDRLNFEAFWRENPAPDDVKAFTEELVHGTLENLARIDSLIKSVVEHWEMKRMAAVDRNILRFATYELLYKNDVPAAVTLNEAIEIAKKFSAKESSSFINGLLDRIAKKLKKRMH
ncbi:Transcription termination protein NusB [hydrothermal vent metagenome]|uniref:Transcription termination protein NusB n=1 Tax=hydrothermal vent metagenome TaxID=652676 RepID=A0A3B1CUR5_9ZZZZ